MLIETQWKYRRIFNYGTGIWAMGLMTYIVVFRNDPAVNMGALSILPVVILGVAGIYTGAATIDDNNRMKNGRIAPAAPPLPPGAPDERG